MAGSGERLDQLALPVTLDAGNAEDLALVQLERHVAQREDAPVRICREVLDTQGDRPGLGRGLVDPKQDITTHHQPGDLGFVRLFCNQVADDLAPAHHGNLVRDRKDFFELMADENNRLAALDQVAQNAE